MRKGHHKWPGNLIIIIFIFIETIFFHISYEGTRCSLRELIYFHIKIKVQQSHKIRKKSSKIGKKENIEKITNAKKRARRHENVSSKAVWLEDKWVNRAKKKLILSWKSILGTRFESQSVFSSHTPKLDSPNKCSYCSSSLFRHGKNSSEMYTNLI